MESEQALNEAERRALDLLSQPNPQGSESENPGLQSEPNSVPESSIDIKDLLSSYNDLSHSFRSYLASNTNEFTSTLVSDLKNENSSLRREKLFLTQKLMNVLQENFSLTYSKEARLSRSQELQFFDLVSQKLWDFSTPDDRDKVLRSQLFAANEVIARQDRVISSLKEEVKMKNHGQDFFKLQTDLKEKNDLKADLHELQTACQEYRKTLEKTRCLASEYWKEIVKLRDVVVQVSLQRDSLQKLTDCLKFEVQSLKEIVKNYESVNLAQVSRVSSSEIQRFFNNYTEEILEVKKKCWKLEFERKELEENLKQVNQKVSDLNENHQQKLEKTLESQKNDDLQKKLEIKKISQDLQEMTEKHEEVQNLYSLIKLELEEAKKNFKLSQVNLEKLKNDHEKTKSELEKSRSDLNSLKAIHAKKLDQLQTINLQETKTHENISPEIIKKLVVLLHKSNSIQTTQPEC